MAALYTTTHLSGEPNRPLALEPRVFGGKIKFFAAKLLFCAVHAYATGQYAQALSVDVRRHTKHARAAQFNSSLISYSWQTSGSSCLQFRRQ